MNALLLNKDTAHKYFDISLVLLAGSFLYYHILSSILTVLIILLWFITGYYKNIREILKNHLALSFILTFIIPFISLAYSHNKEEGLFCMQKTMSLIIFPVVLSTAKISKRTVHHILYSFSISCILASTACLSYAVYFNYTVNSLKSFIPVLYSIDMGITLLGLSHVYLGLYVSCSIIIFGYLLYMSPHYNYRFLLKFIAFVFLFFFLILLGGKMAIISTLLIFIISTAVYIIKTKQWIKAVFFIVLPISIFYITFLKSENVKNRFKELFNTTNYEIGDNQWNNIASRLSILECTKKIFKTNPIAGIGVGDVQTQLDECNNNLNFSTLKGMNPHNQYLQYLLSTGIIGLTIFVSSLIYAFITAYKKKNILYMGFIFLFALCFMTESLLERQHGVMFFAFFNSLFAFNYRSDTETV